MALSPSLSQFKSSGVYRLEYDQSQVISNPTVTIRLIIGFSKIGPFNTPVLISDSTTFTNVFGPIDTALEKKGSFFHRTVLTCLTAGPVIVLNLLNLTDVNTSQFKSISTSSTTANSLAVSSPVSSYFNTDKFWYTDPKALVNWADNGSSQSVEAQRLLNIANVGRSTISVIIRKSDLNGFDILAKNWFSVGQIPEYINENDWISDYLVDVIVVQGDFSNYSTLAIDPVFGPYFTAQGLIKTYTDQYGNTQDGLTAFLNLNQVNVLGVYSGSLLPGFLDKSGNDLYIQDVVNLDTSLTGLLLGFNDEFLSDNPDEVSGDQIDLVGHTIYTEQPSTIDFLSYYGTIVDQIGYTGATGLSSWVIAATAGQTGANAFISASTALQGATGYVAGTQFDTITIYGPNSAPLTGFSVYTTSGTAWSAYKNLISADNTFINAKTFGYSGATAANYVKVISDVYNPTLDTITLQISLVSDSGVAGPTASSISYYELNTSINTTGGTATLNYIPTLNQTFGDGGKVYAFVNAQIYQDNLSGIITDTDKISLGGTAYGYAQFSRFSANDFSADNAFGATCLAENAFGAAQPILSSTVNYVQINAYSEIELVTPVSITKQSVYNVNSLGGSLNDTFQIWGGTAYPAPTNTIWLDNSASGPLGLGGFTGKLVAGQFLLMNFGGTGSANDTSPTTGMSRLTRINSVSQVTDPTSSLYQLIQVVTNDPIYIRYNSVTGQNEVIRYLEIENFASYYHIHTLQGYTLTSNMLPDGTLAQQNAILDVMYNSNIATALQDKNVIQYRYIIDSFEGGIEPESKVRLSKISQGQQSSFVIANMPSVAQFRKSTNPLFKDSATAAFNPAYIATGGNLNLHPSNVFSLPSISDGASYIGFYGPNLTVQYNGAAISVPPAAYISNLFMAKYTNGLPYSIIAGPRRGVVSGTGVSGVEYAFDQTDLDSIEPFGYNAIINKKGFGLVINANQTAQQNPQSALSQIHVRELLIYIEDTIADILENYRWEFNTAQNRLEIKTLCDNFMNQVLSDGGVYDFSNVMDTTNNTPEIIDSQIGILDTYVEPVRGMGVLVNRMTILKTGSISSGNFSAPPNT